MIINRIENKKNLSLRMVKAAKKKGKYAEIENLRNAETDVNTWTLKKCDDYLKENNVIRVGNLNDLRKRCNLLILLSEKNLQHVLSLTKPEARKARNDLNLLEESRVEMIEKISYALIDTNSAIDDGCMLHVDKENSINDDDSN